MDTYNVKHKNKETNEVSFATFERVLPDSVKELVKELGDDVAFALLSNSCVLQMQQVARGLLARGASQEDIQAALASHAFYAPKRGKSDSERLESLLDGMDADTRRALLKEAQKSTPKQG